MNAHASDRAARFLTFLKPRGLSIGTLKQGVNDTLTAPGRSPPVEMATR